MSILKTLYIALLVLLLLDMLIIFKVTSKMNKPLQMASFVIGFSGLLVYILIFFSYYLSFGHFPIIYARENLYFLSLVVYALTSFYLKKRERKSLVIIGLVISIVLLLSSNLAFYRPEPASPFLESIWLYIHAVSAAIAHALYLIAFIITIAILHSRYIAHREAPYTDKLFHSLVKYVRLAFIFHTLMIGSGAVWAQKAWGRLWGWDPVEAWSLASWLVYAAFLHQATARARRDVIGLALAITGFLMLIVSFWGIAYVSETVHTYLKF